MASSRKTPIGLKYRVLVILIISFTIFPSVSAGSVILRGSEEDVKQVKMVLGSRPPKCVNKCLNCRPCVATLVIPPHPKRRRFKASSSSSTSQEDENYYLLTWRCKCGNKLFHP